MHLSWFHGLGKHICQNMCIVGTQKSFTVPNSIKSLVIKRSIMVFRSFGSFPVVFK